MNDRDLIRKVTYYAELSPNTSKVKSLNQKTARKLLKQRWNLKRTKFTKRYIHRILSSPHRETHLPWIFNVTHSWKDDNEAVTCTERFPLIVNLFNVARNNTKIRAALSNQVHKLVDKLLPSLLKTDESCAVSLLSFESEILRENPRQLVKKFMNRRHWPMGEELATIFWEVAEIADANKMRNAARSLWQSIVKNAPQNSPKIAFFSKSPRKKNDRI